MTSALDHLDPIELLHREVLLRHLDIEPYAALSNYCHEGLKFETITENGQTLRQAYLCSCDARGATDTEALQKLVAIVRAKILDGELGC